MERKGNLERLKEVFWLVLGHFIGDYVLQPKWMATQKGESWIILSIHVVIYTVAVFVTTKVGGLIGGFRLSIYAIPALLISHFLIDSLKARWGVINFWVDQTLHLIILGLIALFLISTGTVENHKKGSR